MITLYLLIATTKSTLEFQNERFNHDPNSNILNTNNVLIDLDIMRTTDDKNDPIYLENSDTYDINSDLQKNDYTIQFSGDKIIFNNREKQLDNNTIFLANGTEITNNFKFIIKRSLNTYVQISLALDGFSEQVIIEFECEGTEKNKHFLYNITSLDENQRILTDSGSCNDVEIIINKPKYPEQTPEPTLTPSPTKSYPPSPLMNDFSFFSKEINLTSKGYINDTEIGDEIPIDTNMMNVININEKDVTVYESSALQGGSTLYFNATQQESTLIIDKNVNSSKIGIMSKNSPTVKLQKTNNPLSFYHDNDEKEEQVKLSTEIEEDFNSLVFNDVNNRKGKFSLHCTDSINSVSLSAIMMSIDAEFNVYRDKKANPALLEEETLSDDVTIHVRDKIEIDSETKATLSNFNLLGKLLIHDDSQLTIKKDAIFNESSEIEFIVSNNFHLNESIISGNTQNIQPAISILGNLKSSPSKVTVSSSNGGVPINILDFPLIRTENCSLFESTFQFGGGKSGQISAKCEDDFNEKEGKKVLLLTAVEEKKKKKKLSTGAIVGIAVAAVVVVALIIALIVFCAIKKNKKIEEPSQGENVTDSVGF